MERLTEKVNGGYQLKIPKDTKLSDLEIKFNAYDKLGAKKMQGNVKLSETHLTIPN